ncbi:hypothetical protein L1887_26240 [Cichorium endivia]|nr:hypothetical protein L1887_26240 [Cichorium endivia]
MNPYLIYQCKRESFVQRIKAEEGEGCNIYGSIIINKVAGNFHFVKSFHLENGFGEDTYKISHKINKLAFGDYYPGKINPLDGVKWYQGTPNGIYEYFVKVVPTVYTPISGPVIKYQFSVTEHYKGSKVGERGLPGVFFFYDLYPSKVTFTESHASFLHFLTNLCAIAEAENVRFSDLEKKPRYLLTFIVGCDHRNNIDASIKKV